MVKVLSADTALFVIIPVVPAMPEGISMAMRGAFWRFIQSITPAYGGRIVPENPVPRRASTMRSACIPEWIFRLIFLIDNRLGKDFRMAYNISKLRRGAAARRAGGGGGRKHSGLGAIR